MKKLFAALSFLAVSGLAHAGYTCEVNCVGPSGKVYVDVNAGSASEAASIVDKQGHQICKKAGHSGATSSTMSSSQCGKN